MKSPKVEITRKLEYMRKGKSNTIYKVVKDVVKAVLIGKMKVVTDTLIKNPQIRNSVFIP